MTDIIQFKKRNVPMSEAVQEIFSDMREYTYGKFLPRGLSKHTADEFLNHFEPILISMIPPTIVLAEIQENDANYEERDQIAKNASEQINDYVLRVIGETFHREMIHFLKEHLGAPKG